MEYVVPSERRGGALTLATVTAVLVTCRHSSNAYDCSCNHTYSRTRRARAHTHTHQIVSQASVAHMNLVGEFCEELSCVL